MATEQVEHVPAGPQFVNPLDALEAAESAELEKLGGIPDPKQMVPVTEVTDTGLTDAPPPIPPAPEPAPAPTPEPPLAPVEEPPAAPPVPAPAEPPVQQAAPGEKQFKPDPLQAEKRRLEKEKKEAERELQAERQRAEQLAAERVRLEQELLRARNPETAPAAEEVDPITQMQREIAQLRETIAVQRQASDQDAALNAQVSSFMQNGHEDYPKAYQHYVESEIRQAEVSGEIDAVAARIRQMNPNDVRARAVQLGVTEADISRQLARGVLFEARKQALITGSQYSGRTVAETIYELAKERGYHPPNGNGNAQPAAEPAPLPAAASASEQVRKEQTAASESSIASLPTGSPAPPKRVTSRTQLLAMGQRMDDYIEYMDRCAQLPPSHPDWQPPDWHQRLTD